MILSTSFFNDLRNDEFSRAVEKIISLNKEAGIENAMLAGAVEMLKSHEGHLEIIKNGIKTHPLTKSINLNAAKRYTMLRSLQKGAESKVNSHVASEERGGVLLKAWLREYRKEIIRRGVEEQTRLVDNLSNDYKGKPEIKEALEAIGFDGTFNFLCSISDKIKKDCWKREQDEKESKGKIDAMRREVYNHVKTLLAIISGMATAATSADDEFLKLYHDIDYSLDRFRSVLAARAKARQKNKEEEGGEKPETEGSENKGADPVAATAAFVDEAFEALTTDGDDPLEFMVE